MYEVNSEHITFREQEALRKHRFSELWKSQLDNAFTDIASYYDAANQVASLGFWDSLQKLFIESIHLSPNHHILDVCAGTHAVGIALHNRQPDLEIYEIDQNLEMVKRGVKKGNENNVVLKSVVSDVHHLPFSNNVFDLVTLQWSTRHLNVSEAFREIYRVLKPGGYFYQCDLYTPYNLTIRQLYFTYLKLSLAFVSWYFNSNQDAQRCKKYFIEVLQLFYTVEEMSIMLSDIGFKEVRHNKIMGGMIGFHHGKKPLLN